MTDLNAAVILPGRARRVWRWFARTFGARPEPEGPDDLIALREAAPTVEVQVLAAKLHANDVAVWVSATTLIRDEPQLRWPTTALPVGFRRAAGMARASLFVRRSDVAEAQALISEPSPFDPGVALLA